MEGSEDSLGEEENGYMEALVNFEVSAGTAAKQ